MDNLSPHARRVVEWREHFFSLPENIFFEIIRMYLGNIKTPFNKQKLIEELGSFLRKSEHREAALSLLDSAELDVLAAIKFIEKPTCEKIISFFGGSYSYAFIYDKVLNLEERLLVYTFQNKNTGERYFRLNPIFDDVFDKILVPSVLLKKPEISEKSDFPCDGITPELIAAFISFVYENADLIKADGEFKKKVLYDIENRFGNKEKILHELLFAFLNLSVAIDGKGGIKIDEEKLSSFASLPDFTQRLYMCVSTEHLTRGELVRRAKLLKNIIKSIPETGYTKDIVFRAAEIFLARENSVPDMGLVGSGSRFLSIISSAAGTPSFGTGGDFSFVSDKLIESCVHFGLLCVRGIAADGAKIYSQPQPPLSSEDSAMAKKVLTVDSALSVRVMPGLSLTELLELVRFLEIKEFDTAVTFELTKESCLRGFDLGLGVDDIINVLEKYSCYELPQNLRFTVDDWHKLYSSASIFKGYVLCVESDKISVLESNPKLKKRVSKILAPGVYLLDVSGDEEASFVASELGFDYAGSVKTVKKKERAVGYPELYDDDSPGLCENPSCESDFVPSEEKIGEHQKKMRDALSSMNLRDEQAEELLLRINRKIILFPGQLDGDTVRYERNEAGGMDFSGKIHVIESAISSSSMLEVEFSNPDESRKESSFLLGKPLSIEKENGLSYIRILTEPEKDERIFEIGRISFVKKIRGTIF